MLLRPGLIVAEKLCDQVCTYNIYLIIIKSDIVSKVSPLGEI